MNTKKETGKLMSGMAWRLSERIFAQGVSFIVTLVLARLLSPEDYGDVAIILIFINLADVFIVSGFSSSLIQDKDATDEDFTTIFYCSLAISVLLYILIFLLSPSISAIYKRPSIMKMIRVLGIRLIIGSLNSIQHAYISRHMEFKKFFFSTSIGTVVSAVVSIYAAYCRFGPWALIIQYLVNTTIDTFVLLFTVKWKPTLTFSFNRARELMNFGLKVTVAEFIGALYSEIKSIVIGKKYTSADLAYCNKADQFPSLFVNNLMTSVSSVLFPALSNMSDKKNQVRTLTRSAIRMTSFIVFPMMAGMFVMAEIITSVLLTQKWIPMVPYLRLVCFSYAILPLNTTNVQAIKALGEGKTYLNIELIKKIAGIALIIGASYISVYVVTLCGVVIAFLYLIINIIPNGRLLNYGIREQIKDILPFVFMSVLMGFVVFVFGRAFGEYSVLSMVLQIAVGAISYIGIAKIIGIKELSIILNLVKNKISGDGN